MKRNYCFMAGLAAFAVLVSCSEKNAAPAMMNDDRAWLYDESLPVPVEFAMSGVSVETKAMVTEDIFKTATIGLVGFSDGDEAWSLTDANATTLIPNNWGGASYGFTLKDGQLSDDFKGKFSYPLDNKEKFSFYGYYPAKSANSGSDVAIAGNQMTVKYTIDGITDIMYATAKARQYNGVDGFTGEYIRTITSGGAEATHKPKLQFEHLLTRLDFTVKSEAEGISLSKLSVIDAKKDVKLVVADKTTHANDGTLVDEATPEAEPLVVRQNGKEPDRGIALNSTGVKMDPVMLCPAEDYTCSIELYVSGSPQEPISVPVKLTEGTFEKGKYYAMTIKVNSAEDVEIEIGYTDWQPGTDVPEGEI